MPEYPFQSSPSPKAGRSVRDAIGVAHGGPVVSILAQPEGRALLYFADDSDSDNMVSILAQPEGRALRRHECVRHDRQHVSILAQPEGRALPRTS